MQLPTARQSAVEQRAINLIKVKIFNIMYFVAIPDDGSSWQGPLIYSFANEGTVATDVLVEIHDEGSGGLIATKRLYGVKSADIDIAPYLNSQSTQGIVIGGLCSIRDTKLARCVSVSINGTKSAVRLFVHSSFDISKVKLLSRIDGQLQVERGDTVIFSIFAPAQLRVMLTEFDPQVHTMQKLEWLGTNSIVDIIVQTSVLSSQTTSFTLDIYSGSTIFKTLKVMVVEPNIQSRKLFWRNSFGGVEGYTFPHNIRLASSVVTKSFTTSQATISKLYEASHRSRLCSAFEEQKELERISEIMLSNNIYENVDGQLCAVTLDDRRLEYGSHGNLRQVCLTIIDEWKGGEV